MPRPGYKQQTTVFVVGRISEAPSGSTGADLTVLILQFKPW